MMTHRGIQPSVRLRTYGTSGPPVLVLHGGPGAPGYLAQVARGLEDAFRVLEPLQRGGGDEPLTVARHVADLYEVVASLGPRSRPALVGHSWGAMLALAYAAEYPASVGALALIGCGTFDLASRERLRQTRESRTDAELRRRLDRLTLDIPDPDRRMRAAGELLLPLDSYELTSTDLGLEVCDAQAYRESWEDMVRLQETGVYPAAFSVIDTPVLLHLSRHRRTLHSAPQTPGGITSLGDRSWTQVAMERPLNRSKRQNTDRTVFLPRAKRLARILEGLSIICILCT